MKEHFIKDKILLFIKKKQYSTITECANFFELDINLVASIIDKFIDLKYIDYDNIASQDGFQAEKSIRVNHRGLFFLAQGGFTSLNITEIRQQRIQNAKEAMTYISTAAIIIITYFNYVATDKANDNKVESEKYENRIDQIEKQNDSLINLIKNDTTKY